MTPRGGIDNEHLNLRGPDARLQLAVGNAKGPDDFNGYGYFHVRLYCTGLGFQANIAEEYVLLSALLHIFTGLKRTRDQKLVVFWIDEWSIEFGYHWLDVAHVHDHSPLSAPLCRY